MKRRSLCLNAAVLAAMYPMLVAATCEINIPTSIPADPSTPVPVDRIERNSADPPTLPDEVDPSAGDDAPAPALSDDEIIARLTAALNDKFFEFGSASGNGDRDAFVTGFTKLQLCAFGRFGMKKTTSFSSDVGGQFSEDFYLGTWSVKVREGLAFIDLVIESTNDDTAPPVMSLSVDIDLADGTVIIDSDRARASDAAADCAAAQQQSGG